MSKYSSTTGMSTSSISQTVGFEVGVTYTRTVTFAISATDKEKVNVKVFSNNKETKYEEWQRSVSNPLLPDTLIGTRYAYNPIGSIWKQFRYAK